MGTTPAFAARWLHVLEDWCPPEPVDADFRPTRPGRPSHTVLITHLANRVQPLPRHDLGDSVLQRPDPCLCGDPAPFIRARGRTSDVPVFQAAHGRQTGVAPLVPGAAVDGVPGGGLFRLVQTGPSVARVRLVPHPAVPPGEVWRAVLGAVAGQLGALGLGHVRVERAGEPPEQSVGKFRRTITLAPRG